MEQMTEDEEIEMWNAKEKCREVVVYTVYRNSDMTEGRGPMVLDCAFTKEKYANEYIDTKCGVMGRKAKWSEEQYGDWEVRPITVLDYSVVEEKYKKERIKFEALKKLTEKEKEALGLL